MDSSISPSTYVKFFISRFWNYVIIHRCIQFSMLRSPLVIFVITNLFRSVSIIFVVVQSLSHVWLFVTPWTVAHQASLSFTLSQSLLKLMSKESMMPSNHLIIWRPLLLLPSIFPSIGVFSNELALNIS